MEPEHSLNLADTHCHLNFNDFDLDRHEVVENARKNGISRILIPAIDIETSISAVKYANEFTEIYAAVGIHPNAGITWTKQSLAEIEKLAHAHKVVAIGEIGLDYYRDETPKTLQRLIFSEQLKLALKFKLPVIIHNRSASEDTRAILTEWCMEVTKNSIELGGFPGVMHSFSGDENLAGVMASINFKIGITGSVTYKKSNILQEVVRIIPLQNLVIETDSPFQTPHPHRGERNEPANVRIVAEKIAQIKGIPLKEVANITSEESDKLFKWRKTH